MGREVRRVPADWEHPKDDDRYIPLYGLSYSKAVAEWDEGLRDDWNGERPVESDYMPDWQEAERTHYQMYETITEGTPISPVVATPEELARWLADNVAGQGASYEAWLRVCRGGYAPLAVIDAKGLRSGVEAIPPE